MNILSLCDGISCIQLACKSQNIKVDKIYASEIDKNAIMVTQHHFPNTIQLGDINNWINWDIDWEHLDFIGGVLPALDLVVSVTN